MRHMKKINMKTLDDFANKADEEIDRLMDIIKDATKRVQENANGLCPSRIYKDAQLITLCVSQAMALRELLDEFD